MCSFSLKIFKDNFLKRFQGVTEKDIFAKNTKIQQKGDIYEYTYECEELETQVMELTHKQCLQNYVHGLKQYIWEK